MAAKRFLIGLAAVAFTLGSGLVGTADDKVVGAIWEITFKDDDKGEEKTRRFRATDDGKVFNVPKEGKPKEIGSWTKDKKENIKIVVDKVKEGSSITFDILQVGKNPDTFQGNFETGKGVKGTAKVKFVQK